MTKPSSRLAMLLVTILCVLATVAAVLGLVVAGVIPVSSGSSAHVAGPAPAGDLTPMAVFDIASPGVVEVRAAFATADGSGSGLGSGFVVSKDGYLLTNAHVVTQDGVDASSIVVVFRTATSSDRSQSRVDATLVGSDENSDIAVLKIDPAAAPPLRPLPLATGQRVLVGEPVVAIGNPLGLSFTLTTGVVSATGRNLRSPNGSVIPGGIQTDAAINSGNSGGPLLDSAGRVIGVNTMIITQSGGSQGLGFAVAIDTAERVMKQLKAGGEAIYANLGASGQTLTPELAAVLGLQTDRGVLVARVEPGSPAASAGVLGGTHQVSLQGQPFVVGGDIITAVDGKAIESTTDLQAEVARRQPGDEITLRLVRNDQTKDVRVTLGVRG